MFVDSDINTKYWGKTRRAIHMKTLYPPTQAQPLGVLHTVGHA